MNYRISTFLCVLVLSLASLLDSAIFGTLSSLAKFPVYQTCEAAASAGVACAPYDASKPVKSWVDKNPPAADEDGNVTYLSIAIAKDLKTPAVRDGRPYLRMYTIPRDEAMRLNIPVKRFDGTMQDAPQLYGERPVPMRELAADEELYFGFGGLPMVRKVVAAPIGNSGSTVDVARLEQILQEILAKISILLATSGN